MNAAVAHGDEQVVFLQSHARKLNLLALDHALFAPELEVFAIAQQEHARVVVLDNLRRFAAYQADNGEGGVRHAAHGAHGQRFGDGFHAFVDAHARRRHGGEDFRRQRGQNVRLHAAPQAVGEDENARVVLGARHIVHMVAAKLLAGNIMLPKKMNDIKTLSTKMTREGYNLQYLNLDYNFEETDKKISEIMDRLNVLNLEDSIFELKTLMDYYESLYNDFEKEKRGKKEYERGIINVTDRLNKLSSIIRNLYSEIDDLKDTYALSEDEIRTIDEINRELIEVKDSFKLVNDRTLFKMFPFSKLSNECEMVAVNLSKVEDKLELTLKNLGSLKEDESRA